jgi:DMSO/TMAO reductase YedYZ molybdopterin-dependent catalytic subunit
VDHLPDLRSRLEAGTPVPIRNYPKRPRTDRHREELSFHRYLLYKGIDVQGIRTFVTPLEHFFIRNHFAYPEIRPETWQLGLEGCFERETVLRIEDIRRFGTVTRYCHLECTGNQRVERRLLHSIKRLRQYTNLMTFNLLMKILDPKQWKWLVSFLRATGIRGGNLIGNGRFTGVRLLEVLERHPLRADAKELVFEGIDEGPDTGLQRMKGERHHYARSFEIEEIREYDPLLCFEMNGAPLTLEHGMPLRLIVPGMYGAESVKWLRRIIAVPDKFRGYFQSNYYGYRIDGEMVPVHESRPKSMVFRVQREDQGVVAYGIAWRGRTPIDRVEVSLGDLDAWEPATLLCREVDNSWLFWTYRIPTDVRGRVAVTPRVFCTNGDCQPLEPGKYSSAYGNNAVITALIDL